MTGKTPEARLAFLRSVQTRATDARPCGLETAEVTEGKLVRDLIPRIGADLHRRVFAALTAQGSPWTPRCSDHVVPEPQTTASNMNDTRVLGTEPVGRYRLIGAGHGSVSVLVDCAVNRGTWRPGQRTRRTLRVSATSPPDHREPTTMYANAPKMGREERRALLEQRRAAVARQLRRLAVELTDLDRQLEQIERSER